MNILEERLHRNAEAAESALQDWLPKPGGGYADRLIEAMRYSSLGGGKRLRAHLVLEFCTLCGGRREAALPYAAGIEMMHAFSLIHDDLPAMDNDVLRRGKPTNHVLYGEATALLAGDALALRAVEVVASNPHCSDRQNLEAVRLLTAYAGSAGMCGGQQIDLQSEHQTIPYEELETLADRKTGALFAAACELGCIAAGIDRTDADAENRLSARNFGKTTGMAFQITDDLLDLCSTSEALGKTPGKDRKSGKSTFPALLGTDASMQLAKTLCEKAKAQLIAYPVSDAKNGLLSYCDYITARKK